VPESLARHLPDPAATAELGALLAGALLAVAPENLVLYFDGELGAGKTALIRALLSGLGHRGRVPSPTYTLVEPYELDSYRVVHVDLYRLRDPSELDDLGLDDELRLGSETGRGYLLLAEWPGRGAGRLPPADLECRLVSAGAGRNVVLAAKTGVADRLLRLLCSQVADPGYK
jgi:tRNA threonylcarbamoyladenosine biosynthesis protein TsaE